MPPSGKLLSPPNLGGQPISFRLLDQVLHFRATFLTKLVTEGRNEGSFFQAHVILAEDPEKLTHAGKTTKDHSQRGFNKLKPGSCRPKVVSTVSSLPSAVCHTGSY